MWSSQQRWFSFATAGLGVIFSAPGFIYRPLQLQTWLTRAVLNSPSSAESNSSRSAPFLFCDVPAQVINAVDFICRDKKKTKKLNSYLSLYYCPPSQLLFYALSVTNWPCCAGFWAVWLHPHLCVWTPFRHTLFSAVVSTIYSFLFFLQPELCSFPGASLLFLSASSTLLLSSSLKLASPSNLSCFVSPVLFNLLFEGRGSPFLVRRHFVFWM